MSALHGLPPNDAQTPPPADGRSVPMPNFVADAGGDSPTARKRRDEIVTAATEIIASEGLHRLSLGRIETRCHMSRGQLTYYFKSKEDILLAVFDRMLSNMIREAVATAEKSGVARPGEVAVLDRVRHALDKTMAGQGPEQTELHSLIHTFMAQVRHREDYRRKLAAANAGWRQHIAADISASAGVAPLPVPPAAVASIVMALFQGLGGQLAVDPEAFDRAAVADACLRLLAPLLGPTPDARGDT
ncbi:MAG: TetR/AcrR family transcriptional regulator [Armatimonadaceae bacterium]